MRYVQLRAFHFVAVCGGFSRAAQELFLTQPAISDQVRKLEDEYDVILFNRMRKQVTLTESGEQLLQITRRLFDSEQQALDFLSESRALQSGNLRIVADSAHHLLNLLTLFRQKFPGVKLSITSGNTETVVSSLFNYEADIGVLGEMPTVKNLEYELLSTSPIIAFVARSHPLAKQTSISLAELSKHTLVFRERGSKTRTKLETAAKLEGLDLKPMIEAEGREAVREIVASGIGVGFVSSAEFVDDHRLVAITITARERMMMDEALICLQERRNAKLVRAFFDLARQNKA